MMKIKNKFQTWTKHPSFYAVCFWLITCFVGLVIADFIVMPIVAGHLAFTSEVPNLTGKTPKEAETILAGEDLVVSWDTVGRYSAKVPSGTVLIQVPAAGRRVKEGRTVHLILCKGMREQELPDLRGKSLHQAEITLRRLDVVEGRIIQAAHASIPRGVVIRTIPAAGAKVRMGDSVQVVVSGGTVLGKQKLPDLAGLTLERASQVLDSLGFRMGTVERKAVPKKTSDLVIEEKPASGEFLDPGTVVNLVIVD